MESSSRRSASRCGPVLGFSRSTLPPGGKYYSSAPTPSTSSSTTNYSSSGFATSSSTFSSSTTSRSNNGFFRSTSPTRVKMSRSNSNSSQSVSFSLTDRSISPSRSIAASSRDRVVKKHTPPQKRTCMCSPTSHPGSFRCSLHKNQNHSSNRADSYTSNRLNARRSAMANSLVRIGTVEGDWVKRALAALIRPSSHHQRRRAAFQPRPSRLNVMSKAEEVS